jgi:hypothetical protein
MAATLTKTVGKLDKVSSPDVHLDMKAAMSPHHIKVIGPWPQELSAIEERVHDHALVRIELTTDHGQFAANCYGASSVSEPELVYTKKMLETAETDGRKSLDFVFYRAVLDVLLIAFDLYEGKDADAELIDGGDVLNGIFGPVPEGAMGVGVIFRRPEELGVE